MTKGHPCGHAYRVSWQVSIIVFITFSFLLLASQSVAQPQATIEFRPRSVPLNRNVGVTIEVVWIGEADAYDVPQPDLSGLPEFETVKQNVHATRRNDENRVRHEIIMQPLKEGEYDLGRIRLTFFEKGKDVATNIPLPKSMVKVVSPQLLGLAGKSALGIGIAAAAVVMILLLWSKRVARLREMEKLDTGDQTRAELLHALESARPLLIEGQVARYLERLCEMADSHELNPHIERKEALQELAANVKFGGYTASPDQLNWAEKQVRSAIRKAFPEDDERQGRT